MSVYNYLLLLLPVIGVLLVVAGLRFLPADTKTHRLHPGE